MTRGKDLTTAGFAALVGALGALLVTLVLLILWAPA